MEIVIKIHDIPQNDHERWVLKNGTPLPKGHGRIADIDKVLEEMRATRTYDIPFALERVKPIIEADGGEENA